MRPLRKVFICEIKHFLYLQCIEYMRIIKCVNSPKNRGKLCISRYSGQAVAFTLFGVDSYFNSRTLDFFITIISRPTVCNLSIQSQKPKAKSQQPTAKSQKPTAKSQNYKLTSISPPFNFQHVLSQ